MTVLSRRMQLAAELSEKTGVDTAMIERVVDRFYERVRDDDMLGPIFNERITDWPKHLKRMYAFWSSVMLMSGEYHGQPMRMHLPLPVDAGHFDRWLMLFGQTVDEECPPPAAARFVDRARRIAESMELGIATHNGVLLGRGERFLR